MPRLASLEQKRSYIGTTSELVRITFQDCRLFPQKIRLQKYTGLTRRERWCFQIPPFTKFTSIYNLEPNIISQVMESMEHPPQYSGSFFTPLLISLAGMSGVSIALLSYHFILVKYCIGRRSRNVTTTFHFSQMQRGRLGLEAHVLKAIPVLSFSSERNEKLLRVDQKECVICLGELEEGDKVRLLPNCGHLFHVLCIDDWFLAHSSCPICRSPIIAPKSTILEVADPEPIRQPQESQNPVQCLETDHNNIRWDGNGGGFHDSCAITWQSSNASGSLRRSLSLVLPLEWDPRQFAGLKRSLSLDQSIVIDMPREIDHQKAPSCTCSSTKGIATEIGSMSSRFLRSFSQMRIAPRNVPAANEVLPF